MTNHKTYPNVSREVHKRAVRMVLEHRPEHASQWAAIVSIASAAFCSKSVVSQLTLPRNRPLKD